jgi:hypothetical protein
MDAVRDWMGDGAGTAAGGGPTGLIVVGHEERSVPLKRREVSAKLLCDAGVCDTVERLSYVADADVSASFRFPLPPRAAVYR